MVQQDNLKLMETLDDAWNSQATGKHSAKCHAENVAVYWPGQPVPTRGRKSHYKEGEQEFYGEKGYSDPIRCKDCRNKRKAEKRTSGFRL